MRLCIWTGHTQLLQFGPDDCRELYCIRNHESVRRFMSRSALIPYRSHMQWVRSELLDNPALKLFLVRVQRGARAAGLTQLRISSETAEIGVMFREPQEHRMVTAVATVATIHAAFERFGVRWLTSYVLPEHTAAIQFNKDFGAWEEESDKPNMVKLRLDRDTFLKHERSRRLFSRICAGYRVTEVL